MNTYLGIEVPVRFSLWFEYPVMTGKNEELVSDVKVRVASNSLHSSDHFRSSKVRAWGPLDNRLQIYAVQDTPFDTLDQTASDELRGS